MTRKIIIALVNSILTPGVTWNEKSHAQFLFSGRPEKRELQIRRWIRSWTRRSSEGTGLKKSM